MKLCKWEKLPPSMQTPEVRGYYTLLQKRRAALTVKRMLDVVGAALLLLLSSPVFFGLAVAIKLDSPGKVFYRQTRVTQYGRTFRIHKFRTMVENADQKGALVTSSGDTRVTHVGQLIRKSRLDELPQLIDVLVGSMTFVGTRPEVPRYVSHYTPEMMATLLLPAGVTSLASIFYADEEQLLNAARDPETAYIRKVLPEKMKWNLRGLREFSFAGDLKILWMTFMVMLGKKYSEIR